MITREIGPTVKIPSCQYLGQQNEIPINSHVILCYVMLNGFLPRSSAEPVANLTFLRNVNIYIYRFKNELAPRTK